MAVDFNVKLAAMTVASTRRSPDQPLRDIATMGACPLRLAVS